MSYEIITQVKNSFFAKRVITTLEKGGPLDESKLELLDRITEFVIRAQQGKKQIDSGKLAQEPVKSISAYKAALNTFFIMDIDQEKDRKCFEKILDEILDEVDKTKKEKNEVSKENLPTTYSYFVNARKLATRQASRQIINQQELVAWPTPMKL